MANVLTMQLRPTKKYTPPSVANLFHDTGLSKATYWLKKSNTIISNLNLKNLTTKKTVDLWQGWIQEATDLVIKNKNKAPQKKQVLIEEGLLVIGKDVKVENAEDLIKIFEEFKDYFEKKYNTKILGYFYHNHEGHIDENEGNFVENRHIHFFFRNIDNLGNSVRRQIKKSDLSEFQTKIYEIGKKYIPNLQRATNYAKLGLKAPKHKSHREYRTAKIKQELVPQLVKKAEENKKLKEENEDLKGKLAKQKDLKEENKKLRNLLKELGAERQDYALLEQFVKDLKQQIKDKELTIQELQNETEKLKKDFEDKLLEKNEEIESPYTIATTNLNTPEPEITEKKASWEEVAKFYMRLNELSENENEQLKKENDELKEINKTLEDDLANKENEKNTLKEENERLKAENQDLKKMLNKLRKGKNKRPKI